MLPGVPGTPRERNRRRNDPAVHSVLAVCFKGTASRPEAGDGVSTYLALIFGTLLSSQGTDASFVLTLAGFPPGASRRSCVSDSIRSFRSDFLGVSPSGSALFAFPFPAAPTLSGPFLRPDPQSAGYAASLRAFTPRPFDIHHVSRFPRSIHNRACGFEIQACEHDEFDPAEGRS